MTSAAFPRFPDAPDRHGTSPSLWRVAFRGEASERVASDAREVSPVPRALSRDEMERAVGEAIPAALRLARRLSGDEGLAEEAVQEALLRVAKSWRRFRGEAAVSTWLSRIVIHCVRDALRRRPASDQLLKIHEPQSAAGESPDQQAITAEIREAIVRAVAKLPNRQREVFALVVWEGMPTRDVAELLSIDTQNVHANLHAARTRLRSLLASHLEMPPDRPASAPTESSRSASERGFTDEKS